jgi:hypothetical protein
MQVSEEILRDVIRRRIVLEEIKSLKQGGKLIKEQQQQVQAEVEKLTPQTQSEIKNFIEIAEQFQGNDSDSFLNLGKSALQTATFFGTTGAMTIAGVSGGLWGGFYGALASAALAGAIGAASYAAIGAFVSSDDILKDINNILSPSTTNNNVKKEVDGLISQINNKRIRMPACTQSTTSGGTGPASFTAFVDPNNVANPTDFLSISLGSVDHFGLPSAFLAQKATNILNEIHKAANATLSSGNPDVMKNIVKEFKTDGITLYDFHQIDSKVGEMINNGSYTTLQFKSTSSIPGANITTDFSVTLNDFKQHYASKSDSNILYLLQHMVDVKGTRMYTDEDLQTGLSSLPLETMTKDAVFALPGDVGSAMQCYVNQSAGTLAHYQVKSLGGTQRTSVGQNFFASIGLTIQQKVKNAWRSLKRIFNAMLTKAQSTGSAILSSGLRIANSAISAVTGAVSGILAAFGASSFAQWLSDALGKMGDVLTGVLDALIAMLNCIINYFNDKAKPKAKTPTPGGGGNQGGSNTGGGTPSGGTPSGGTPDEGDPNQTTTQVQGLDKTGGFSGAGGGYIKVNLTGDPSIRTLFDIGFASGTTSALYDDIYSRAARNYVGSEDLNFKIKMEVGSPGDRRVTVRLARGERRRALRGIEGAQNAIKTFLRNAQIEDTSKFGKAPSQRVGRTEVREFELVIKVGSKR